MAVTISRGTIQMTAQGDGVSGQPAPDVRVNPDGSWVTNRSTLVQNLAQRVNSITIDPGSSSWVVVLSNQNGKVVWSAEGTTANSFFAAGLWDFNGIVLTTATNVTRVSLAFDYIQWNG